MCVQTQIKIVEIVSLHFYQLEDDAVEPHGEGELELTVQPQVVDLQVVDGEAGLFVIGYFQVRDHRNEEHVRDGQEEGNNCKMRGVYMRARYGSYTAGRVVACRLMDH